MTPQTMIWMEFSFMWIDQVRSLNIFLLDGKIENVQYPLTRKPSSRLAVSVSYI